MGLHGGSINLANDVRAGLFHSKVFFFYKKKRKKPPPPQIHSYIDEKNGLGAYMQKLPPPLSLSPLPYHVNNIRPGFRTIGNKR